MPSESAISLVSREVTITAVPVPGEPGAFRFEEVPVPPTRLERYVEAQSYPQPLDRALLAIRDIVDASVPPLLLLVLALVALGFGIACTRAALARLSSPFTTNADQAATRPMRRPARLVAALEVGSWVIAPLGFALVVVATLHEFGLGPALFVAGFCALFMSAAMSAEARAIRERSSPSAKEDRP